MDIKTILDKAQGRPLKIGFVLQAAGTVIGSLVEMEVDRIEDQTEGTVPTVVFTKQQQTYFQVYQACTDIKEVSSDHRTEYVMEFPDISIHVWF